MACHGVAWCGVGKGGDGLAAVAWGHGWLGRDSINGNECVEVQVQGTCDIFANYHLNFLTSRWLTCCYSGYTISVGFDSCGTR